MKKQLTVLVMTAAVCAMGATVSVSDYNWCQLPVEDITAFMGNHANPCVTPENVMFNYQSADTIELLRWAMVTGHWVPNGALTQQGQNDYWVGYRFEEPKNVQRVDVRFNGNEQWTAVRRFTVEGAEDANAEVFATIGDYDFGVWTNGLTPIASLDVTNGTYTAIRVRLNGHHGVRPDPTALEYDPLGDLRTYQPHVSYWATNGHFNGYFLHLQTHEPNYDPDYWCATAQGGPSVILLEPYGDGMLDDEKVNFANRDNFPAVASVANISAGNTGDNSFNSGSFAQGEDVPWMHTSGNNVPWRDNPTKPGIEPYFQIDLGAPRAIYRMLVSFLGQYSFGGNSTMAPVFAYADDASGPYTPVPAQGVVMTPYAGGGIREYVFPPIEARYWRIVDVDPVDGSYISVSQWLMFESANRPPVAQAKDITWTLSDPVLPLTWEYLDDGSYDPDGDPLTISISRYAFWASEVGTQVPVTFTVSDGKISVNTNVLVTVALDSSLKDTVIVNHYGWLQLPPEGAVASAGLVNDDVEMTAGRPLGGDVTLFRWGTGDQARGWHPPASALDGTDNCQSNCFAAVTFDRPRCVDRVRTEWCNAWGMWVTRFHIDGTVDGVNWTEIGFTQIPNSGSWGLVLDTPVAPGLYSAIRVRMMAGNYTTVHGELLLLEPFGFGAVLPPEVNWANQPNFGAATATLGMDVTAANLVEGSLRGNGNNGNEFRTGTAGAFAAYPAAYVEVDLGESRWCDSVTAKWGHSAYATQEGTGITVYYSTEADGDDFYLVPESTLTSPIAKVTRVTFAPVKARRFRVADAMPLYTDCYLNEVMVGGGVYLGGTLILVR
ncbi:MAG: discoidin domain-containing protein [Kiritimatiellaeota bacterium]|nr:discoidin domain-containing protein [Kiritimatiellota bacterium]